MTVGERAIVDAARVACQRVDTGDDRRCDACAAKDQPAARAVGVIDRDAGARVGHGGDIGDGAPATARVVLPAWLGNIRAASTSGTAPDGLAPAARIRSASQARAAHSSDILRGGRELNAIAAIAGADSNSPAGVVEVAVIGRGALSAKLAAAVAIADRVGAQRSSSIDRRSQIREAVIVSLDKQDLAVRADRASHIDIKRDLLAPPNIARRVAGAAALIDFAEAAVGGCAWRQAKLRTVHSEVGLGVGVVEGIDDRDGLGATSAPCQVIGRSQISRAIAGWGHIRCRAGSRRDVGAKNRVAARGGGWPNRADMPAGPGRWRGGGCEGCGQY